jgi:fumarylacetoacetase
LKFENLKSFIPTDPDSHFPIQNLPFGIFKPKSGGNPRAGAAIGNMILDLAFIESKGLLRTGGIFSKKTLNDFMSLGREVCGDVRNEIQKLLLDNNPILRDNEPLRKQAFVKMSDADMCLPCEIPDYTDFYSSREHAQNVGTMFRGKENALMPNWLHLPVAYHGRASSIVVSGTNIHRPMGQIKTPDEASPQFGPTQMLDFELEMGALVGTGNNLGSPVTTKDAMSHVFGMVIVNDWSARDIQKWEYVPLGPFLGKNFATSISPWVVTLDALEPFKTKGPQQNPEPLPYLRCDEPCSYDITLEVYLTPKSNKSQIPNPKSQISKSNFKYLYWNICQQIAHHTINGCNLRSGDLLASGTISGPEPSSHGSMLELSWNGKNPLKLTNGVQRTFLEDGDTITITAYCQGSGYRIGFGELVGIIVP